MSVSEAPLLKKAQKKVYSLYLTNEWSLCKNNVTIICQKKTKTKRSTYQTNQLSGFNMTRAVTERHIWTDFNNFCSTFWILCGSITFVESIIQDVVTLGLDTGLANVKMLSRCLKTKTDFQGKFKTKYFRNHFCVFDFDDDAKGD